MTYTNEQLQLLVSATYFAPNKEKADAEFAKVCKELSDEQKKFVMQETEKCFGIHQWFCQVSDKQNIKAMMKALTANVIDTKRNNKNWTLRQCVEVLAAQNDEWSDVATQSFNSAMHDYVIEQFKSTPKLAKKFKRAA